VFNNCEVSTVLPNAVLCKAMLILCNLKCLQNLQHRKTKAPEDETLHLLAHRQKIVTTYPCYASRKYTLYTITAQGYKLHRLD